MGRSEGSGAPFVAADSSRPGRRLQAEDDDPPPKTAIERLFPRIPKKQSTGVVLDSRSSLGRAPEGRGTSGAGWRAALRLVL